MLMTHNFPATLANDSNVSLSHKEDYAVPCEVTDLQDNTGVTEDDNNDCVPCEGANL